MSQIKFMGITTAEIMVPIELAGEGSLHMEHVIDSRAYACLGENCGLVWDRKNHAIDCEKRGHLPYWEQHYGFYRPVSYTRKAIGRINPNDTSKVGFNKAYRF